MGSGLTGIRNAKHHAGSRSWEPETDNPGPVHMSNFFEKCPKPSLSDSITGIHEVSYEKVLKIS